MNTQEKWNEVDQYVGSHLTDSHKVMGQIAQRSEAAGLPQIQVSPPQGKMLHLFAKLISAKKILEIGTLGGYSAVWMAQALPQDGKLITLEIDPKAAKVASENFKLAEVDKKIELILDQALESLPRLKERGPFDLIFIDADKAVTAEYFDWAVKLGRKGTLIVVDNVIRDGRITEAASDNSAIDGMRRFFEALAKDQRVTATAIQTVGCKGYDGFALAMVN